MASSELCPRCQAAVSGDWRFCAACGQALDTVRSEIERRQLTIFFCDVVQSTALSERLDPEDWRDLLTSYHRTCRDVIERYEGRVAQFLGDGVMSYFGYPIANEDDAVRAVRAALRIIEMLELLNQGIGKRLRAEIHVRAGLHTGVAVVGDGGANGSRDAMVIGETVNLAARIQTFAEVDAVVVSGLTARLVEGHFELERMDPQSVKGITRAVELFRVVRSTGARSTFEAAARRALTPHVGRASELAELANAWQEAERGADRVVVLRGEAGIGKSRMLHEFRQVAVARGARVVECFCSPLLRATALAPIIELLNQAILARPLGKATTEARLEVLSEMLSEHSRFGPDALALIANLLSIQGADQTSILELSPVRQRTRMLEVMRTWLSSSAERIPVAVLVEDAHWADPSTLDLLDLIVNSPPGGRTLVCVTGRPEFPDRWSHDHVRTIELARLHTTEIEAMVKYVAGAHVMPTLMARRIAERSEGVPLYVEEITKAVVESGAPSFDGSRAGLTRAVDEESLPTTVQGALVARFDRLGESRSIAQIGAAIGREFTYPLIRAVADEPDDVLLRHLDRLGQSEIAIVHGNPPNSRYIFKHALIQDAIYSTLLRSEWTRIHARIFTVLEEQFPAVVVDRPEMVAYHAEKAGRPEAAVALLRDAGMRALGRTALAEAVKHLAHAVELVTALEEPARSDMELELQAALSPAYMATLGWATPQVERSTLRLQELAAAKGDGGKVFRAMWGLWTVHFMRGKLDRALDASQQVLATAEHSGDPMLLEAAHHAAGYTHYYRAEYALAVQHANQGLALFDFEREKVLASMFQLSSSTCMWCYRAHSQQLMGLLDTAADGIRRCAQLADELRHAPSRAYLLNLCYCFRLRGDVEQVAALAPIARSLSIAEGFAYWVPRADIFMAWADAQQGGDPALAVSRIKAANQVLHDGGTYLAEPEVASMHAETLLLARQPERAFDVAREALDVVRGGRQRHGEPELYRLQGNAAGALGNRELSASLYRQGIDCARSMGARLLELRCALALAQSAGGSEARAELKSIVAGFTDGIDQPDCRAALAILEAPSNPGDRIA
jgi:predicted ATPase/class 3 adenylate cyclase